MTTPKAVQTILELLDTPLLAPAFEAGYKPDVRVIDAQRFFDWLWCNEDAIARLSTGEQAILNIAHSVWNGSDKGRINDLWAVDRETRIAILEALLEAR